MHKSSRVLLIVLVSAALILLPACSTTATEAPAEPAVEDSAPDVDTEEVVPAGEIDTEEEAPAAESYDLDAATALVEERCVGCHGLSTVTNASYTEEEWASTVARMISQGANLNDQESELVIQYLADQYGP